MGKVGRRWRKVNGCSRGGRGGDRYGDGGRCRVGGVGGCVLVVVGERLSWVCEEAGECGGGGGSGGAVAAAAAAAAAAACRSC